MALGDPVLVNLSGCTFLLTAETGGIIQSSDRTVDSKDKEVFDASRGATIGDVYYDFKAMQPVEAILNGTTGIAAAQPGVAIVLANDLGIGTNKNGVSAGGLYTQSVQISHRGEDLRSISLTTKQRQFVA